MSARDPQGALQRLVAAGGGDPRPERGQAIKGFVGNFLPLISDHGEPPWILEQRKTVFNEDNSSSCVEDGGKEGRQDTSQTLRYAVAMEMEMRMKGNNSEEELAATGADWRCGLSEPWPAGTSARPGCHRQR